MDASPDQVFSGRLRRIAPALVVLAAAVVGCAGLGSATDGASGPGAGPRIGQPAPEFVLPDHDGRPVGLADLRGRWVVLYFYPSDDTPGCTREATEFTGLLGEFEAVDATVLGVSADAPLSHRFFRAKHDLHITLLSDMKRDVMRRYGAWREARWRDQSVGRTMRSTFLIDPGGRVAWRWDHVIPGGHAEEVRRKLEQLAVRPALRRYGT